MTNEEMERLADLIVTKIIEQQNEIDKAFFEGMNEAIDKGAEFTVVNGWERVDYIKPSKDFKTTLGFKFDEAFDQIEREVRNVQQNVGLCEVNGFNRIEITGSDRHNFLDRIFRGYVVDFIDIYVFNYHWPAFNIADSCISVGFVILIFNILFLNKKI